MAREQILDPEATPPEAVDEGIDEPGLRPRTLDDFVGQADLKAKLANLDNTEVEVVRGGWKMGETILRFAQVRVAAAPDAPQETAEETSEPEESAAADEE